MNRIVARRVIATIHAFKVPTRGLTSAQQNSENKEKLGSINGNDQYDIAIVGGGMVGMALACALSSSPLKKLSVAIIDSNPALGKEVNIKKDDLPDPRVSTVTPASISFFKGIIVISSIYPNCCVHILSPSICYFLLVWDYTGLGYARYTANDVDADVLGCVVENKGLHSSLLSCLQVGADEGKSHVRELARIKTTGWNYSQNAIICTVKHTVENHCAWQRFLPSGPIALLPIGDEFSNIVWTMIPKEATKCKSMSGDDFVKPVNHALHDGYGPNP
ncbi:hypothetical protein IFM89_035137 [Coptis chinensis]|uniref:Uncharacterized protein n=1 Tax=Coptis chinensis TaxID=261450 RepID=A0A835IT47_9MAGN|nr:hypothetical protein IFM89_035137 [Coptis chinensis]